MNEETEPWSESVSAAEVLNETRALLRKHTRFNEHELVIATCYIMATWLDDGKSPETDSSLFRSSYPDISEHSAVQQMVHPNYRIGRS